jgi:hypothetical protein
MNIVDGFKFVAGKHYASDITQHDYDEFLRFYKTQVRPDPYAKVRDRGMIKIVYNKNGECKIRKNPNQSYFQSYSANDSDGGVVRVFPTIDEKLIGDKVFLRVFEKDLPYIDEYCNRAEKEEVNISVHFIRYKAETGGASFSSPIWLHVDDEPLVFIHLIQLTENAIGADSVISGMDSKPTNVLRLSRPFDTLIVDKMKKHAVTPLGSSEGTSYRDVMLINVEAEVQQK